MNLLCPPFTVVCYSAVFSVVTQRSSPLSGEERCVTTLKTAVRQTTFTAASGFLSFWERVGGIEYILNTFCSMD